MCNVRCILIFTATSSLVQARKGGESLACERQTRQESLMVLHLQLMQGGAAFVTNCYSLVPKACLTAGDVNWFQSTVAFQHVYHLSLYEDSTGSQT